MKNKSFLLLIVVIFYGLGMELHAQGKRTIAQISFSQENQESPDAIDKAVAEHLASITNSENRVLVSEKPDGKYTEQDILAIANKFGKSGGVVDLGNNRTYVIKKPFIMKTSVSYIAGDNVIWDATHKQSGPLEIAYNRYNKRMKHYPPPNNITFYNIHFKNISFAMHAGGKHVWFLYCLFDEHKSPGLIRDGYVKDLGAGRCYY